MKLTFKNLTETGAERLLYLADYLDRMPKRMWKKFDMGTWLEMDKPKRMPKAVRSALQESEEHCSLGLTDKDLASCGTMACALGWAASLPKFQRQGLTHYVHGHLDHKGRIHDLGAAYFCIFGEVMSPLEAAGKFFELSGNDVNFLFGGSRGDDPKDWAAICRYFVQTDGLGKE